MVLFSEVTYEKQDMSQFIAHPFGPADTQECTHFASRGSSPKCGSVDADGVF